MKHIFDYFCIYDYKMNKTHLIFSISQKEYKKI